RDWSSDVCYSDLLPARPACMRARRRRRLRSSISTRRWAEAGIRMRSVTSAGTPRGADAPAAGAADSDRTRALVGLIGILIPAMIAGLNNRVGAAALADVRGALGFGLDDASWLATTYSAGELIAMPFAAWFAITLSVRRFSLWMLGTCLVLALVLPFTRNLDLLLAMRFLQGVASGTT